MPELDIPPEEFGKLCEEWARVVQAAKGGDERARMLILEAARQLKELGVQPCEK